MILLTEITSDETRLFRNLKIDKINEIILLSSDKISEQSSRFVLEMLNIPYVLLSLKGFEEGVVEIAKILMTKKEEIGLALSKRDLGILQIIYALALVKPTARLFIEGEEMGRIKDLQKLDITQDDITLLQYIGSGIENISKLSKIINSSMTTTWRKVKELEEKGLVEKGNKLQLTRKGKIAIMLNK
ncbi:hypothetical protein SJAV_08700 [Sulfurisphaera javensis]|uniref:CRISPR locus-related DNA-binding protein n=1 Tax=Sulfurisphaera javensis TaxID=2049879 RepID=A0AAT9GQ48_9CREN